MSAEYKYRAFISYSHKDEKWAAWLHRALETFRVPKNLVGETTPMGVVPERLGKLFRDREELATSSSLGSELTQALEDSACQIVICSPNAAQSRWTNEEILTYKRLGREKRIFCLIVDGEPNASLFEETAEFECFPEALMFQIGPDGNLTSRRSEPIAADVRPEGDGKQNAKIKLIAGMLGVGFDALKQREAQRRQKRMVLVTAAATIGMIITTGLAALALIARNEAEFQRNQAEIKAETARRTTEFMVDLFKVSDPSEALGNSITAREILDKGAERIETELEDQPEIQATLMDTMGTVYTSLGLYGAAVPLVEKALSRRRQLMGNSHLEVASTLNHLGVVKMLTASYDEAEANLREALAVRREVLGDDAPEVAETLTELADVLSRQGDYAGAEPLIEEALALRRTVYGEKHAAVAESLEDLALNVFDQGDFNRSLPIMRDAVALRREVHEGAHPDLAEALNNLGFILGEIGEYEESEKLFREALAMKRILFQGEPHPEVATGLNNVAFALQDQGKLVEAEPLYREAIAMQKAVYGPEHPDVALSLNNLAFLLYAEGDYAAAISVSREALTMFRNTLGNEHPFVANSMNNLGMWLLDQGDYELSEPLLQEALNLSRKGLGADHVQVADSLTLLADLQIKTERYDEAYAMAVEARNLYENTLGRDHWRTAASISAEGAALAGQEDYESAELLLQESFAILKQEPGALPYFKNETAARLVNLYQAWGKPTQAAEFGTMAND